MRLILILLGLVVSCTSLSSPDRTVYARPRFKAAPASPVQHLRGEDGFLGIDGKDALKISAFLCVPFCLIFFFQPLSIPLFDLKGREFNTPEEAFYNSPRTEETLNMGRFMGMLCSFVSFTNYVVSEQGTGEQLFCSRCIALTATVLACRRFASIQFWLLCL